MEQFEFDVFFSYSHSDKEFVVKLAHRLRENGFSVHLDFEQFRPGMPILAELERGIESSRYNLIVLSPEFLQSSWSEFETLFIQLSDPAGRKGRVIPLIYKECDIPLRLAYLVSVDFTESFDKGSEILIKHLRAKSLEQPKVELSTPQAQTAALEEVLALNRQILGLISQSFARGPRQKPSLFIESNIVEDSHLCFILMPFGPKWSRPLFDKHITPACTKEGFKALRADDIYGTRGVMQDVWIHINRARIVVADLTTRNPNVFYEVGLAHALGKDVILITQTMDDVPFDLHGVRCIVYSLELDGPQILEENLAKTIKSITQ